jgi:ComF family protein
MFGRPPGSVNLSDPEKSTIIPAVMTAWLRARSPHLPLRQRLSFRVLPPTCLLCGLRGDQGALDLCSACLAGLPWLGAPPRIATLPLAPLAYAAPLDRHLRALKFHGDLRPARVFGALLAAARAPHGPVPQRLVPVPLHRARLRERGFNQAAAIARHAGCWLGVPVAAALLERVRATQPQTELTAHERHRNVAGAFRVPPRRLQDCRALRHVALLDDVLTTGATAAAAAAALRAAGIEHVEIWAVAHALPARPAASAVTT